tara:strand:- start:446 stop:853 length:408 start_codon:yes stop_codon:yes gene_type:complete
MEKYYEVLGLPVGCSDREVIKKYRELSLKLHPDRGGNEYLFNLVNEAYNRIIGKDYVENKNLLQIQPFKPNLSYFKDYFSDIDDFIDEFDNTLLIDNSPANSQYYSRSVFTENINGQTVTKEVINDNGVITEKYY